MNLMVNIKRYLQFVVAMLLLILAPVQPCSANDDNSQLRSPVIFSSSNHNLLSINGAIASGKIVVKNNGNQTAEKFSIKGDIFPVIVDPDSSCFKSIKAGGTCEFNISYVGAADSLPRISVRFEVIGDGDKNSSDSITVNVINVKPEVFFNLIDDTNVKGISRSALCFTTVKKNEEEFLYVGTSGGGIFKTNDGGITWVAVNNGLANLKVQTLYSSGGYIYVGTDDGVFRTSDGGTIWVPVNSGLANRRVWSLYSSGDYLYAGTDKGVFKISNDGINWTEISSGLPPNKRVWSLYSRGDCLYAGTDKGVFKISNGAANWIEVGSELTNIRVRTLHLSGDCLYAGTDNGVFKISNDEVSWMEVNSKLTNKRVWILHSSGDYLYAGTDNGVFRISNDGAVSSWLTSKCVKALHSYGDYLYAGTWYGGVFKTNDGEINWTEVGSVVTNKYVKALYSYGEYLYAETLYNGVFKTNDGGISWIEVSDELVDKYVRTLHFETSCSHSGYLYKVIEGDVFKMKMIDDPTSKIENKKELADQPERLKKEVVVDMQNDCEKACKEELIRMRANIRKEDREKCSAIIGEMQKNVGGSKLFHSNMPLINPVPPPVVDYLLIPPGAYETVEGMHNACENACKQELIQKRYAIRKEDWEKCSTIIKEM